MSTEVVAPSTAIHDLLSVEAAIESVTQSIIDGLQAGDPAHTEAMLRLQQVLLAKEAEGIDKIVLGMLAMEKMRLLSEEQAAIFQRQADGLKTALDVVRATIQRWMDGNLPEDNRKLQGSTCVLRTQSNSAPSLILYDPAALPANLHSYELSVYVPADDAAENLISAVEQFAQGLGLGFKLHRTREGSARAAPDEERIKQHLAQHSEAWGTFSVGRHLRTKPSLTEARKAVVKT